MMRWELGDIKEGTRWNEHWVLYAVDESLNYTPKTKNSNKIKAYIL